MTGTSIESDVQAISRLSAVPTILEAVARATGMRFTAIARVTDTHWTACAVYDQIDFGVKPGGDLVLESTICDEIRQHHQPVVFGHASEHPVFATHPTPKLYGFESYISVPIFRRTGEFFGTLCAIDPLPAKLDDPNIVTTLHLFGELIAAQLDIEERLNRSTSALSDARETGVLREQFIAVLGHDLRNPLQMIALGTEALHASADAKGRHMLGLMRRSCDRMAELIDNILDFARGKLGGGIALVVERDAALADEFRQVIAEIQAAHPERSLTATIDLRQPVVCDRRRLGQLFGNLVSNAISHGDASQPIIVLIRSDASVFELSVTNAGAEIPADMMAKLFQPFVRSAQDVARPGLGLGLYIAAEIAKAHGGALSVDSSAGITRFVYTMPVGIDREGETPCA